MDDLEHAMHLRAGHAYGKEATCGRKVDYKSEASAERAAEILSIKLLRDLEHYPCVWCGGWHIGRRMTQEEVDRFTLTGHVLDIRPYVLWTEWRAECSCGWTSSYLETEATARREGGAHIVQGAL